ncbi:MAG: DUF4198 domain-containing protein [Desulfobacteraceae bacterium]|nr:DUF4198 domain-containing protein [Desulfobacteraceae bacterium]
MLQRTLHLIGILTAAVLIVTAMNSFVAAHGVAYRIAESTEAVAVEFVYSSGDPMSYAQVMVWSPETNEFEFQNGRTDKNGRFAFAPGESGTWRIEANDGRGHKKTAAIHIDLAQDGNSTVVSENCGSGNKTLGAILGLSLIANIAIIVSSYKKRSMS